MKLLKKLGSSADHSRNRHREAETILRKDSFKEAIEEIRKANEKEHERKLKNELKLMELNSEGAAVDKIHEKVMAGYDLDDGELKILGLIKI